MMDIDFDEDSGLLSRQPYRELEDSLRLLPPGGRRQDIGAKDSEHQSQLALLPPELLSQILSYIVVVPGNVHIYAPQNNSKHGWRLSLCPESYFDPCWGNCGCLSGRPIGTISDYMDTALLLVSRAMRQTTMDIIFAKNHFIFTGMHDLREFASELPPAAARIQSIRLYHAVDDSSCSAFQAKNMVGTRQLLKSLRHLDLRVLLSNCSSYKSMHEDGFLNELSHFRKPLLERFECTVQWRGQALYWRMLGLDEEIPRRVEEKLIKIFTGVYGDDIPFSKPPPEKVKETDQPLSNKKGIIAWS